jgi:hypothetical protein
MAHPFRDIDPAPRTETCCSCLSPLAVARPHTAAVGRVAKSAAPAAQLSVKARAQFRECYLLDERKLSPNFLIMSCNPTLWGKLPPRGWGATPHRTMDQGWPSFI